MEENHAQTKGKKYILSILCEHENRRAHTLKQINPTGQETDLQQFRGKHIDSKAHKQEKTA
jgi:hypothetical protein